MMMRGAMRGGYYPATHLCPPTTSVDQSLGVKFGYTFQSGILDASKAIACMRVRESVRNVMGRFDFRLQREEWAPLCLRTLVLSSTLERNVMLQK